jgi:hypothetical protein
MRTMSDICITYAPEYRERSPPLPASHHKAMDALCRCRTGAYGSRCLFHKFITSGPLDR